MVRDAPILILDEPTTGLDAATARRMMGLLKCLMEGRTTIIVSHDPDAVRDADLIVILEGAQVVETGTHEEPATRDGAGLHSLRHPNAATPEFSGNGATSERA